VEGGSASNAIVVIGMLAAGNLEGGGCPPVALLRGDPALVEAVRVELAERGVSGSPVRGCEAVRIGVQSRGSEIALAIEAAGGSEILRTAGDAEGAATIIESWARSDLTAPLLEHELPPDVRKPVEPSLSPEPSVGSTPAPLPSPPSHPRPFALSLGAVAGRGSDGSTWSGADLRGCFQVWHLCVGGRLQHAVDLGLGGDAARLDGERSVLDLGLTADVPLVLGHFEIVPGAAIGLGNVRASREVGPNTVEDDAGGLRLRAQIGLTWRFAERWSLRLDTAVDYAPFSQPTLFESILEDGPEDVEIPGDPTAIGWLRVGLEVGGI
jgi:hypothetical protein